MIIKSNVKEALRSLVTSKQRSLLALLGIVIGIGSVIGMVSIGTIVENESLKQFKDMGIDIVSVTKAYDEESTKGGFAFGDVVGLRGYGNIVQEVAPYLSSGVDYKHHGKEMYMELLGVTEAFFDINKLKIEKGRILREIDEERYFCVIGADTAQFLRKIVRGDLIGKEFAFGVRIYTVVGILKRVSEGGGMRPSGINGAVMIPIKTAMKTFQNIQITMFLARMSANRASQAASLMNRYFARKIKFKINVRTAEELIKGMEKQMRLFTLLLGAIGSISLIVGGIGVMNVMLVSVSERRKEIGIRRALGAHRTDIQSQFIVESIILCLVGGIAGILLGLIVSYVFARVSNWAFGVSWFAILLGFGVSTGVGVFFGYYPARTAAKLNPIDALRRGD